MKQLTATIATIQPPTSNFQLLILTSPELPQLHAGQLMLIRDNNSFDPYLRRAYFPLLQQAPNSNSVSLLVSTSDLLSRKSVGATVDIIAPIGNGFALDASTRRLLLAGDESHISPLIALAHEATQKLIAVTLLIEQVDQSSVQALEHLLPLDVEYQVVPNISDLLLDLLRWPDQLCAAGSSTLYTKLRQPIAQMGLATSNNFSQVIVAPPMACGFGACLACAVETPHGISLACVDGPVFHLSDVTIT